MKQYKASSGKDIFFNPSFDIVEDKNLFEFIAMIVILKFAPGIVKHYINLYLILLHNSDKT